MYRPEDGISWFGIQILDHEGAEASTVRNVDLYTSWTYLKCRNELGLEGGCQICAQLFEIKFYCFCPFTALIQTLRLVGSMRSKICIMCP